MLLLAFVIVFFIAGSFYIYKLQSTQNDKCNFYVSDVKAYFNKYRGYSWDGKSGDVTTVSWDYEGLIRNTGKNKQYIKGMIVKLYNEKGVLIGGGYTQVEDYIDGSVALPFKVNVQIDRSDTADWHYYEQSSSFKPDIYPWFTTCK